MADSVKRYTGERVEVTFDARRCLHAARCVNGLPAVFDVKRRPWVLPDGASAEQIAEIVRRCPSGALHYQFVDGEPEQPTRPTRVSARAGEPIWLRGDLLIDTVAARWSKLEQRSAAAALRPTHHFAMAPATVAAGTSGSPNSTAKNRVRSGELTGCRVGEKDDT